MGYFGRSPTFGQIGQLPGSEQMVHHLLVDHPKSRHWLGMMPHQRKGLGMTRPNIPESQNSGLGIKEKQHAEVAVEALAGWEQAKAKITALKKQFEDASQKNVSLVDLVGVVTKKSQELESENSALQSHITELKEQLEAAKSEASTTYAHHDLQGKLQEGDTARKQHLESVKQKAARLERNAAGSII